jgi:hypothetical protein
VRPSQLLASKYKWKQTLWRRSLGLDQYKAALRRPRVIAIRRQRRQPLWAWTSGATEHFARPTTEMTSTGTKRGKNLAAANNTTASVVDVWECLHPSRDGATAASNTRLHSASRFIIQLAEQPMGHQSKELTSTGLRVVRIGAHVSDTNICIFLGL